MDDSYHYYLFGMKCLENKEYKNAIHYFEQSLELDQHFKTYEKLYECYKNLGNKSLARENIRLAYNHNIRNDKVAFIYATDLHNAGLIDEACKVLEEILIRNSTFKKARELLNNINIT